MLKKNLLANYSSNFVLSLLNVICTPIYLKTLGVEFYGLVGFYLLLQNFIALLDLGMTPSTVREMASFSGGGRTLEQVCSFLKTTELIFLIIATIIAFALIANANFIINGWLDVKNTPKDILSNATFFASILVSARFIESFYKGALIGLQDQVWLSRFTLIIQALSHIAILLWIFLIAPSVVDYFAIQLLFTVIALVGYKLRVNKNFQSSIKHAGYSIQSIIFTARFGLANFGTKLLSTSITQTDKLILSKLLSLENFGFYMLAVTATNFLLSAVGPISQSTYPKFIQLVENKNKIEFAKLFHNTTQLTVLMSLPICVIFILFPEKFVYVWTGNKEVVYAISMLMIPLTIGTFANVLMSVSYQIQLANSILRIGFFSNLVLVIFLIPTLFFFVPTYGAVFAAWTWASINLGYLFVVPHIVHRKILTEDKNTWYFRDIIFPLLISMALGYILRYSTSDFVMNSRHEILFFLGFIFTALSCCLVVSLSFSREILKTKIFGNKNNVS